MLFPASPPAIEHKRDRKIKGWERGKKGGWTCGMKSTCWACAQVTFAAKMSGMSVSLQCAVGVKWVFASEYLWHKWVLFILITKVSCRAAEKTVDVSCDPIEIKACGPKKDERTCRTNQQVPLPKRQRDLSSWHSLQRGQTNLTDVTTNVNVWHNPSVKQTENFPWTGMKTGSQWTRTRTGNGNRERLTRGCRKPPCGWRAWRHYSRRRTATSWARSLRTARAPCGFLRASSGLLLSRPEPRCNTRSSAMLPRKFWGKFTEETMQKTSAFLHISEKDGERKSWPVRRSRRWTERRKMRRKQADKGKRDEDREKDREEYWKRRDRERETWKERDNEKRKQTEQSWEEEWKSKSDDLRKGERKGETDRQTDRQEESQEIDGEWTNKEGWESEGERDRE